MTGYLTPHTSQEALTILQEAVGKARVIAGGTDLLPEIRSGKATPEILVDITGIPDLQKIQIEKEQITIGSCVNFSQIINHPILKQLVPMLTAAAGSIGAGAIQQTATWGGNLVQAMPAADGAIAALALEAKVGILDSSGEHWVAVDDIFQGPGQSIIDSSRELLTAIRFPYPSDGWWGTAWSRVGRRSALILPILNCAVKLIPKRIEGEIQIKRAIIALGPSGKIPFRSRRAEESLIGATLDAKHYQQASIISRDESNPRSNPLRASREYRLELIPTLISSALDQAADQIRKTNPADLDRH